MFASRKTKAIDTPTDPAYTVTIKALSGRAKQRAATAVLAHAAEMIQAVGGAEVFAQINSMSSGERAQERRAAADPAAQYDRDQLLVEGIVAWSAPEELTPEAVGDLEEATADLLHREICALSGIPRSAADVEAAEVAAGND